MYFGQPYVGRLDRAGILLGAGQDLGRVAHQYVVAFEARAVKLHDEVEVSEMVPVEHDVLDAPDVP